MKNLLLFAALFFAVNAQAQFTKIYTDLDGIFTLVENDQFRDSVLVWSAPDVAFVTNANSPFTLTANIKTVFVDCTDGATSITLLQGASLTGNKVLFVRTDNQTGNSVTVVASTGSIFGPWSLDSQYESQGFVSDGTNHYAF